jgi:hypothetical protein
MIVSYLFDDIERFDKYCKEQSETGKITFNNSICECGSSIIIERGDNFIFCMIHHVSIDISHSQLCDDKWIEFDYNILPKNDDDDIMLNMFKTYL